MDKHESLISQMTLEEKASLCSGLNFWNLKGIERLGVPTIMVTDGPHGLRKQITEGEQLSLNDSVPATCFPTAAALAATWDRDLIFQVGQALGEECRQEKVGVILGPGANIKRSPVCGRNFEYFSEDPYLSGEIAKSHINGVQSEGIGTSLKHYAVNNQEHYRLTIDVIVDERALREIYLAGYEIAVKGAQPWTLMGAYNLINGEYACEHAHLLTILKEEWEHEGLVVTDWGAMNDRVKALKAGLEIEMPGVNNGNDAKVVKAIENGDLDEAILNRAVGRILDLILKAAETLKEDYSYDPAAHHALARQVAASGAVLLRNENQTLPLAPGTTIALIGDFAKNPRFQGAGSSLINPTWIDTLYDEMLKLGGKENIRYAQGYTSDYNAVDQVLINEAVHTAQGADVVVIHAGLPDNFEVEGLDRSHLRLPESHNQLIEALVEAHPNVVVVLSNGSPVAMPWAKKVQAILEGYLGGQAGSGGLADILFGIVNPSGKLAETFPYTLEDTPSYPNFPGGPKTVEYRESIYVGYRFYETVGKAVQFPFGFGLSYTNFEYSDLELGKTALTDNDTLMVKCKIKNTGERTGKEIVQVYVNPTTPTAFRPRIELKGFAKIELAPGEEKEVRFQLERRAFTFYNTALKDWQVESGEYGILVGASSQDIRLSGKVQFNSSRSSELIGEQDRIAAYKNFPADANISAQDFETLYGKPLPDNEYNDREPYTLNTPIMEMRDTFVTKLMKRFMQYQLNQIIKDNPDAPNAQMHIKMVTEAPLRMMMMLGDGVHIDTLDALLEIINGKPLKGLGNLIKSFFQKR